EVSQAICSMIFGGVLERLPALRVCFAHGGGAFAGTLGRIQHGFDSRPDLMALDNPHPPTRYLGRFWVDSLVHDPRALRLVLDTFGSRRVALGTDYPFPLGEERPGALIRSLELPASTREDLLARNGLEWLGREAGELDLA
ncbi:MAG TPA: amidohydrolase family protein, partial [Myxococcales bacterium]|nr:amidohydrolase family protein [Myxococcales bacterium]